MTTPDEVSVFRWNMPSSYPQQFDHQAICEHYEIARQRGLHPAHAEVWRTLPSGLSIVCVVAEDYPGLLSAVTTAFLLHRLNVVSAQIYSRQVPGGGTEAVDFFWLQRRDGGRRDRRAPAAEQLAESISTLITLVTARALPPKVNEKLLPANLSPARAFFQKSANGEHELVIEAFDGPGLMTHIARTLYELNLSVFSCEIDTVDGLARDRFVLVRPGSQQLGSSERERVGGLIAASIDEWRAQNSLSLGA